MFYIRNELALDDFRCFNLTVRIFLTYRGDAENVLRLPFLTFAHSDKVLYTLNVSHL